MVTYYERYQQQQHEQGISLSICRKSIFVELIIVQISSTTSKIEIVVVKFETLYAKIKFKIQTFHQSMVK